MYETIMGGFSDYFTHIRRVDTPTMCHRSDACEVILIDICEPDQYQTTTKHNKGNSDANLAECVKCLYYCIVIRISRNNIAI